MKAYWIKFDTWLMALNQRERLMVVGATAAMLVYLTYMLVLDPAYTRERTLRAAMVEQRMLISGIDSELIQLDVASRRDPDREVRERLRVLQQDSADLRAKLRSAQKGLVAPEHMGALLQQMVKGHGKLRLVSLRTLPPQGTVDGSFAALDLAEPPPARPAAPPQPTPASILQPNANGTPSANGPGNASAAAAKPPAGPAAGPAPLLFRHGVQLVLQGSYLEMIDYLEALESMPTQLFWGAAALDADQYPQARLTLTLYTLSLDQKWIAL
ncbi:type II secretion system protein M [Duganella sp. BJB1802]|uniref:type II secretion system protein GspM n=1 Tax=Duganella sp. BJB1802 TaxID=2744575 RepID=UPI0015947DC2|nr:type II secretion system protein GspM [Duganella sp. BJB1802]NVD74490.1 type II secretion system protein M [Duganella sp. BJB1802]